ncbi:unnamed protein product [Spodoptera littoralis]|uniref:Uncharacterized protein n=1 Tax=Spodoptera littoralis TaxID=7109 RepID=A0A9P0I5N8_SPOLI|nr:unnamed protein product [Spodoptera littoralis]CAH1639854.1 unnamed protein product [Spodoptera littoralis]
MGTTSRNNAKVSANWCHTVAVFCLSGGSGGACVGAARVCVMRARGSGPPSARPHSEPTHVAGAPHSRPAPRILAIYYHAPLTACWLPNHDHRSESLIDM